MIQTPINVEPQNTAFDTSGGKGVVFTFKGDFCSGVWGKIYDYDTGALVKEFKRYDTIHNEPLAYNDKIVTISNELGYPLVNGRNYILQLMLIQKKPDNSAVICDMPVFGDRVGEKQSELGSTTSIIVEKDITSIYPWGENNGVYSPTDYTTSVPFCRMTIRIGDEIKEITSYTNDDENGVGIITVDSAFSSVTAGTPYKVYCNYLITPQYYFECRSIPTVTFTNTLGDGEIHCQGVYSQTENDLIKYYQLSLQWSNNSSFVSGSSGNKAEIVETTRRIYSQNIDYWFLLPYRHDEDKDDPDNETYAKDYYRIICNVVTQGGQSLTIRDDSFNLTPYKPSEEVYGSTLYAFDLQWDSALGRVIHKLRGYGSAGMGVHGSYELTREDLISGEIVQLPPHHFGYAGVAEILGYDLTASTRAKYRYTLKLYNKNAIQEGEAVGQVIIPNLSATYDGIGHFPCNEIETSEYAYYITELEESVSTTTNQRDKTSRVSFDIGDTWVFRGDIQDTTVTNNMDAEAHVGYSRYITSTSTDVNYQSGTLTAMLGYVNCANRQYVDDISLVKAWRKFITQKKSYLLKSQKGDVWIVNIVNTPTTTYEESNRALPTTISFDWAESYGLDEVVIHDSSADLRPVEE